MSYNVGINVIETDGRSTPSIVPAPTSVGAFLIRSERGFVAPDDQGNEVNPAIRVTNWSQFIEYFGDYVSGCFGAYSVKGFFDNGGTMAYVTRIVEVQPADATPAVMPFEIPAGGTWDLQSGGTLTFSTNLTADVLETDVFATRVEAELIKGEVVGKDLRNKSLSLRVNGVEQGPYNFDDGFVVPSADALADIINVEFDYVSAGVTADDEVFIRTDQKGGEASLEAFGDAADALELSGTVVQGSGTVENILAVTPDELIEVFSRCLNPPATPLGFVIAQEGGEVRVQHPNTGTSSWIQVTEGGSDVLNALGIEAGYTETGTDGSSANMAMAADRIFSDADGNHALRVTAAYRGQRDPGVWGNEIEVKVTNQSDGTYTLIVSYRGNEEIWEKLAHSDLPNSENYRPEDLINSEFSGSRYIKVERFGANHPADTSVVKLGCGDPAYCRQGAEDTLDEAGIANAAAEALSRFDTKSVQLVCCPESSQTTWIEAVKTYCSLRGDCMFLAHTPFDNNVERSEAFGIDRQGEKVYGAMYFPWIRVRDPIGDQVFVPPTGHVMGVYARTERERGIWKAPAGNAATVRGALDVKYHITDIQHTSLVKNGGVNAARYVPGKGIVVDSSRTLSTNPIWFYVNVRLLFNFVKTSLKDGLTWVVQEPNDQALWNKIKYNSVRPFLMSLWRRGAFGPGAPEEVFEIKIDSENNTPEMYQQGTLKIEVYFYPNRPAETIVIVVGQQEGGATAAES